MAKRGVVDVSTVVGNKVTKTVSDKTAVGSNSRCSERARLTSLGTQSSELSRGIAAKKTGGWRYWYTLDS